MKRLALVLVALLLLAAVAAWFASAPRAIDAATAAEVAEPGDAVAGKVVFYLAGCESCHQSPG